MGFLLFAQEDENQFFENTWPESFTFPFGEWLKQLVFWAVNNPVTSKIIDIVEWPFSTFFDLIMSDQVGRDSIQTIPWVWIVIGVFLIASFTRNTRVGFASAVMLAVCGFLGPEYWTETSKTIGMIVVSVTLCALVGIPLGILSGRFDGVWNVVRPTLDAMQVVHSFVYMLPFIFFFGIGEVSATMVTMVFALPPLVRLTNLGIRQVPEDVVEAARSYGATEARVLTDVQLPLARPAIMTGLNQTLLLAFSMLGIAALMGAGGLGRLLFRAINNLNLGLAASAGLAFFLLAVILDRISQTELDDGIGLGHKIRQAWVYRANPEALLEERAEMVADKAVDEPEVSERPAPINAQERMGLMIGAAGGLVAVVSIFLTWTNDAGLVSSWARRDDEALAGLAFNGYQASGGSVFGIVVGVLGLLGLAAAIRPMLSFPAAIARTLARIQGVLLIVIAASIAIIWVLNMLDTSFGPFPTIGIWAFGLCIVALLIETFVVGTPRLGSDGVLLAGFGVLAAAVAFMTMNVSVFVETFSRGPGVIIALIAGVLLLVGGALATFNAPYGPRRPLPDVVAWGRVATSVVALALLLASSLAIGDADANTGLGWFYDGRLESLETPEFLAEIQALEDEAGDDINKQLAAAQEISNMYNSLRSQATPIFNGFDSDGPRLGPIAAAFAALAVLFSLMSAGVLGKDEKRKWRGSVLLTGAGLAIMVVTGAFTVSIVRVAEPGVLSGIGTFLAFVSGFVIFASGRGVVNEFRRRKVYGDATNRAVTASETVLDVDHLEEEVDLQRA